MNRKGKRNMNEQTERVCSEQKPLCMDESVEVLKIERSSTLQDRVVTVLYEARAGPKTYFLKITTKGMTLV